jgi:hypothetical protein
MSTHIDALAIRRSLGRHAWAPPKAFGPDGWCFDNILNTMRIIVSASTLPDDDRTWIHASISAIEHTPTYGELVLLHRAVWGEYGHAYQCFVPPSEHVNIHEHALHLWGLLSGERVLPNFGFAGTI